jgi:magnesium chelatase family protein
VPAVKYRDLADRAEGESSVEIAKRVCAARKIQLERFKGTRVHCNAQMASRQIRKFCEPDSAGHRLLEVVTDKLGLSARAYTRILKVARTIADLEGTENIREQHIAEAIQYRSLDRKPA